jgi:WD40 repeat protein
MVPRGHSCISGWSTMCLPLSLSRLWFFPACLSALRESHISMLPNARMQSKPLFFSLVRRMIATLINRVAEKASAHSGSVLSVAFSPDGTKIVSGSEDGTIKAWSSGALGLLSDNAHRDDVTSVAFSPDGTKIVSGSRDKTIKVWDLGALELLSEKTNAHSHYIILVAFSPDGTKIVSGSDDKTIKVWDFGAPRAQNCPSATTDACWLAWQPNWSC